MLSDPFLQQPRENSVEVVWFTEVPVAHHYLKYGDNLEYQAQATTTILSKAAEDVESFPVGRYIYRHQATAQGLIPGVRWPYQVVSGQEESKIFTLTCKPLPSASVKVLLTSDHQLMPMTAANLQKVVETVGRLDAVFMAGDLVNVSDRASEWFDDVRGGAFFPCLQGRAHYNLNGNIYQGGEILQHTPIFTAIGNHEVMGRYNPQQSLQQQFEDTYPREKAQENNSYGNESQLKNNSYNIDTYQEIFRVPPYYSVCLGNIWLGVLYVTNMWRSPLPYENIKGRYQERKKDLENPLQWGYGQIIYEAITPDSTQYNWLQQQLQTTACQNAQYKIVMFHHPPHTLGGNIVPPYTQPIPRSTYDKTKKLKSLNYDYPPEQDYIIKDLLPLLEAANIHLVFYGHSHLWNRFISSTGMNFLESSNVGNTYGAHWKGDNPRLVPEGNLMNYAITGDPNGLEPIVPNIAPLLDIQGQPFPYIASNEITVFSILDTLQGTVSSYRFDTQFPQAPAIKFDEFPIK